MKSSLRSLTDDLVCKAVPSSLDAIRLVEFDALVASVGFENRARYFCEAHRIQASKKLAYAFTDRNILGFADNQHFFDSNGFKIDRVESNQFSRQLLQELDSTASLCEGELRVCIDISSMSRSRMADVVEVALMCSAKRLVVVDFVYCVAQFNLPPSEPTFIEVAGPVTPFFAGWTTRQRHQLARFLAWVMNPTE